MSKAERSVNAEVCDASKVAKSSAVGHQKEISLSIKQNKMNNSTLITTSNALEGYRVTLQLGLVRGITVRSRSVLGNMAGGVMALFGGRSSIYTELCEKTREEALQLMIRHANEMGANAIINMRYDANEVMAGMTEVLAYGTAVVVEKTN